MSIVRVNVASRAARLVITRTRDNTNIFLGEALGVIGIETAAFSTDCFEEDDFGRVSNQTGIVAKGSGTPVGNKSSGDDYFAMIE